MSPSKRQQPEVNVGTHCDPNDKFHRYKMPVLATAQVSRLNGVKTSLNNIADLANCLYRPTLYLVKFLCFTFGCNFKHDKANDIYIITGSFKSAELMDAIQKQFVEIFVLCKHCYNPETEMILESSDTTIATEDNKKKKKKSSADDLVLMCSACNKTSPIDEKAYTKLYNLMLREVKAAANQPKNKQSASKDKSGGGAKNTMKTTSHYATTSDAELSALVDNMEITRTQTTTTAATKKKWLKDDAAVRDKPKTPIGDALREILAQNLKSEKATTNKKLKAQLRELRKKYGVDNRKILSLMFKHVLCGPIFSKHQKKRTAVLGAFTKSTGDRKAVMRAIEHWCVVEEKVRNSLSAILDVFYDKDVLGEEFLLAWYDGAKALSSDISNSQFQQLKLKAAAFIDWLKQAE